MTDHKTLVVTKQTPMPSIDESLRAAIKTNNPDISLASDADKLMLTKHELNLGSYLSDEQTILQDAEDLLDVFANELARLVNTDEAKIDLDSVRVSIDEATGDLHLFYLHITCDAYKPTKANV